ncbi:hypothetical protein LSTR_LSTR017385 [Laodelphax striatellus]|uniref:Uncharacterized protein n=1 Tax=Laodelphax striatellus TaxID=195883 RepID=A0A482WN13_LAOST|nr:hypothetical protein LSTR_LSTR017385 [Laodelphax striatellus]
MGTSPSLPHANHRLLSDGILGVAATLPPPRHPHTVALVAERTAARRRTPQTACRGCRQTGESGSYQKEVRRCENRKGISLPEDEKSDYKDG